MLRFHRFTIGRAWVSDYGSADEPEGFDYLYAYVPASPAPHALSRLRRYSPLHNVDSSKIYPPTMLLTADHDDRVVPLHSFKHAAELQHQLPNNPNPLLLRVDTKSGHGAGKVRSTLNGSTDGADRASRARRRRLRRPWTSMASSRRAWDSSGSIEYIVLALQTVFWLSPCGLRARLIQIGVADLKFKEQRRRLGRRRHGLQRTIRFSTEKSV